jgi:hypothetical protein
MIFSPHPSGLFFISYLRLRQRLLRPLVIKNGISNLAEMPIIALRVFRELLTVLQRKK